MSKKIQKFNGEEVTLRDIGKRRARLMGMGYPVSQWLLFCELMLKDGYKVTVKETPHTKSKYVRVHGAGDTHYQVRFSDHKPNKGRELAGDCHFFVGYTHTGVRNTNMAITATKEYFNAL